MARSQRIKKNRILKSFIKAEKQVTFEVLKDFYFILLKRLSSQNLRAPTLGFLLRCRCRFSFLEAPCTFAIYRHFSTNSHIL